MKTTVFIVGLAIALIAGFVSPAVTPLATEPVPQGLLPNLLVWVFVGGLGILVGLVNVNAKEPNLAFFGSIGLVVTLTAILAQPFNPIWLENVVFWVRVFVAHVLLVTAVFTFIKTATD